MKTSTSVALKFAFLFILAPHSQAEEHSQSCAGALKPKADGRKHHSSQIRSAGIPRGTITQFQEIAGARPIGKSEVSPKHELKNNLVAGR